MINSGFTVPTVVIYHPDPNLAEAIYWHLWTHPPEANRLPTLYPLQRSPHKTSEFPQPVLAMVLGLDDPQKGYKWAEDYLADISGHRKIFDRCPLVLICETDFSLATANRKYPQPGKERIGIFDYRHPEDQRLKDVLGLVWQLAKNSS